MNNKTGILENRKNAVPLARSILERRLFSQTLTRYRGPCRRRGPVKLAWEVVESVVGYFYVNKTN